MIVRIGRGTEEAGTSVMVGADAPGGPVLAKGAEVIDAIPADVAGSAAAGAIIAAVVGLVLIVLYFVALISIITKAGYSGAWVLIIFVPVIAWVVTSLVVYEQTRNSYYSTFDANTYVWAWIVDAAAYLIPVIFFFVFAFSQWPVQKKLRALQSAGVVMATVSHAPASTAHAPTPAPAAHALLAQPHIPPPSAPATTVAEAASRPATMQAEPPSTRFCIHCGARNSAGAEFCGSCGNKVEA